MDVSLLTSADLALRPGHGERSPWLREAMAAEGDPPPAPPPRRHLEVDVAIVGGGYTGLWTAYQLTERAPELRIAILEQDICGGGPSGRNGGFVNGWWDELDTLVDLYGEERALAAAREVAGSVHAIRAWCEQHGVDAHFRRGGMLTVSTTPLHDDRMDGTLETVARLGVPEAYVGLTPDEVRTRCDSPRFRNGALMADGATVHPAFLVRGLRRVALERGVAIHETTRATSMTRERDPFVWLRAEGGASTHEVRARHVVLAVNAWATAWRPFRNRLLAWGSYMVRSEPIPDRLADLGWTGGESIVDARASVHYLHATRDGRVAIGAGGGRPGFDGRIGPVFTDDVAAARRAAFAFRWFFPQLADVGLTDAWGGPIDISPDHLPCFGTLPGGRVHYGFGYSGNGVAPSHLGGRILAALALESDEPITRLAVVNPPAHRFPPEPMRYVGARVLREAMIRREDTEEAGHRPAWWLRELTRIPRRLGYHLGPGG
ncbi:MAG TPA: FAD-dependent oxidoreductase [Candidatus Dormibacteraeota bacterium]|nr:FAD-dependent oxidoreductase [Candidatus Dormibacteraeota bacterium]